MEEQLQPTVMVCSEALLEMAFTARYLQTCATEGALLWGLRHRRRQTSCRPSTNWKVEGENIFSTDQERCLHMVCAVTRVVGKSQGKITRVSPTTVPVPSAPHGVVLKGCIHIMHYTMVPVLYARRQWNPWWRG